jgi:hypothetical protein
VEHLFRDVITKDFIDYGFESEFIGRLPVRVVCDPLSADDLFAIMKTSEGSLIRQYEREFAAYGIKAVFHDDALREIAARAADGSPQFELFDYANDPFETRNHAAAHPEVVRELSAQLALRPELPVSAGKSGGGKKRGATPQP